MLRGLQSRHLSFDKQQSVFHENSRDIPHPRSHCGLNSPSEAAHYLIRGGHARVPPTRRWSTSGGRVHMLDHLFPTRPPRRRLVFAKTTKRVMSSPSLPEDSSHSIPQLSDCVAGSVHTGSQLIDLNTSIGPGNPGPRKSLTGLLGSNLGLDSRSGARTQLDFNVEPS